MGFLISSTSNPTKSLFLCFLSCIVYVLNLYIHNGSIRIIYIVYSVRMFSFVCVSLHYSKGADRDYIVELNYVNLSLFCDMASVDLWTV
jgi:hypothetical protein